jgi:predicted metal-dependent hydrolase
MITDSIRFGTQQIDYRIVYSARKTLGISVTPEMEIVVKAPENISTQKIKNIVRKKAGWITKQRNHFEAFQPRTKSRRFINGETHLYLGRSYKLIVKEGSVDSVILKNGEIQMTVNGNSTSKEVLSKWYRSRAEKKFSEIMNPIMRRFRKYKVEPSHIALKVMPKRWGSCTPKGTIILNPELIKASRGCIEYVMTHEMCHLVHHGHTRKFYELQKKEMPDWEKWKMKLERILS